MFEQNELVVVKNLGDGNEYDGVIFGEIKIDDSFSHWIVYMIDKIPGHEKFRCASFSQSCVFKKEN